MTLTRRAFLAAAATLPFVPTPAHAARKKRGVAYGEGVYGAGTYGTR